MAEPTVLLATCAEFPLLEESEQGLPAALAARGVTARPAVWDDPQVRWAEADLVVVRNTWDYAERLEEFLEWLDGVSAETRVANPPEAVRWNIDKRYLTELAADGLPVVPTRFAAPGEPVELPDLGGYVVKPSVSAGSRDTARFTAGHDDDKARLLAQRIHGSRRHVMVQPYLESVDERGETALLHIGGVLSHAIRKGALLRPDTPPTTDLFAAETITPLEPTDAEQRLGAAVVEWLHGRLGSLVFARVDLVHGPEGPMVLEVELTEPSLFCDTAPGSLDRLAAAIVEATVED